MSKKNDSPHDFKSIGVSKGGESIYDYYYASEQRVRESQIAFANTILLQEELSECVLKEGINANVNCFDLRKKYFDVITKDRYHGMLFPEGEEPANRGISHLVYVPNKN